MMILNFTPKFTFKKPLIFLVSFAALLIYIGCRSGADSTTFYISMDGDDSNSGTSIDNPLHTLEKALVLIKDKGPNDLGGSFKIILRKGIYQLSRPIIIDNSYNLKSLQIKSFKNEKVVISGGQILKNKWTKTANNIWEVHVDNDFNQLFREDERLTRARWPNQGGYLHPEKLNVSDRWMSFSDSIKLDFKVTHQTELVATGAWHFIRQRLESSDSTSNTIITQTEIGPECSSTKVKPYDRIYFENNIGFLDSEGEWFLNKDTSVLSMFTASNPNESSFHYPMIETLFRIEGDKQKSIANIDFEGLTFKYTTWKFPNEERKGIQAGFWGTQIGKPVFSPPAALILTYSKNCNIIKNEFKNLGEGAIALESGARHTTIERNTFYDIGSNVIQIGRITNYIGEGHPLHLDYEDKNDAPEFNTIANNHFKDFASVDNGGVGILITYSNNNKIIYNLIEEAPYTGISVGWRWGSDALLTNAHHNEVSYNEVRKCMQYLSDGGAIYTVSNQPGTVITHNWIHEIGGGETMAEGIYTDEGSGNITISNNYVNNVQDHDYKGHINLWETMTIKNNGCENCENILTSRDERVKYSDFGDNKPPNQNIYGIQNEK